ncbi:hypothetical protein [Wenzhouxiangella sp. EGI_FJ10305]|uniref:hypothetical protein n=1 Tax=Wenzhouxiangella sp. EGI_FJ10305 TaxID=3243768 RepID=UPI0035DCE9C2
MTNRMLRLMALLLPLASGAVAAEGQYLRVSLALEDSQSATFLDQRCQPSSPRVAYFGCIDGDDGRPIGARGDFGSALGAELAWGMHLGEYWRAEFMLGTMTGFDFEGNANFLDAGSLEPVSGDVEHWRAGVRGYLDVASAASIDLGRFEPYIGLGAYLARNEIETMNYRFPELASQPAITRVPGDDWTGFGWSVSVGTAFELNERHLLDLSLGWHEHGKLHTAAGEIDVIRNGESVARVPVGRTRADLESWGVMLGWRWRLD